MQIGLDLKEVELREVKVEILYILISYKAININKKTKLF